MQLAPNETPTPINNRFDQKNNNKIRIKRDSDKKKRKVERFLKKKKKKKKIRTLIGRAAKAAGEKVRTRLYKREFFL